MPFCVKENYTFCHHLGEESVGFFVENMAVPVAKPVNTPLSSLQLDFNLRLTR